MPSIDIKSPPSKLTNSQPGHSRNRNMKDNKSMNLDKIIGMKNSHNRHDDDNIVRLPQMALN